jgi:hypothetical protein
MLVHRKAESSGADERESNSIVDMFRVSDYLPIHFDLRSGSSPLQLLRVVYVLRTYCRYSTNFVYNDNRDQFV